MQAEMNRLRAQVSQLAPVQHISSVQDEAAMLIAQGKDIAEFLREKSSLADRRKR